MPITSYKAKEIRGKVYFTIRQTYPDDYEIHENLKISLEKIRNVHGAFLNYAPEGLHTFVVNPHSPEEYFDIENNSIRDTIDGIPTVQYALNKITQDMAITIHKESHISNFENAQDSVKLGNDILLKQFIALVIDLIKDPNKRNKYTTEIGKVGTHWNNADEIFIRLNCHREIADFLIEPNKDKNGNITSLRSRVLEDEEVIHLLDNAVHLCEVLNKLVDAAKVADPSPPSLINHWRNELGKLKRFIFDRTLSTVELVALKEKHESNLEHFASYLKGERGTHFRKYDFYPKEGREERLQRRIDKLNNIKSTLIRVSLTPDELLLINHIDPTIKIEGASTGMVQWWKAQYDAWENKTVAPFVQEDYSLLEVPEPIAYDNYRYQYLTPEQVEELIAEEEAEEAEEETSVLNSILLQSGTVSGG